MTRQLFEILTAAGAEWVMKLLVALSVLSIAIMLERLIFFARFGRSRSGELMALLSAGKLADARLLVEGRRGLEASATLAALEAAEGGTVAIEQAVAGAIASQRTAYERFLSFLGTLGNNAPFLGLFGTVIGIIRAFADLSTSGAKAGAATVMAGISEALVATAVGIFVAIPAVVAFNAFGRWLKTIVSRTQAIGHALATHVESRKACDRPRVVRAA